MLELESNVRARVLSVKSARRWCKGKSLSEAGASLVQLYTSFAYVGPALVPRVKRELYEALKREGFKNVNEAIGYDVKRKKRKSFMFF